jgi:hypothetical protein
LAQFTEDISEISILVMPVMSSRFKPIKSKLSDSYQISPSVIVDNNIIH